MWILKGTVCAIPEILINKMAINVKIFFGIILIFILNVSKTGVNATPNKGWDKNLPHS
jgi:hypothetical protein